METMTQFRLTKLQSNFKKEKISSSKDSARIIRQFYHEDIGIYESFFILLLNRANYTQAWAKIGQGGVVGVSVDQKIIAKYIVDSLASAVIIAHNHPSGTLPPSSEDKVLTKKIQKICQLLDTTLLDHIILTEESYYSFADNVLL